MAVAGDQSGGKEKTDDIKTGKRISPDWVLGIGESVGELGVVQSQQKDVPATIVVTKSRSLTALLAAEVLFLERILAAQTAAREAGSRKPRKISRPAPAPAPLIGNRKVV